MSFGQKSVLEQLFEDCYPADWCVQILQALNDVWRESRDHCRSMKFGADEGHDLLSHYCRARFETELRRISSNFPCMAAESRKNCVRTYSHTYVNSTNSRGESLVLTASAVRRPNDKPRCAEFRSVYNANGQIELFPDNNKPDDTAKYGLLLYGPPQANSLAFVKVAFPSSHWQKYVEVVDLIARYPGVISIPVPDPVDIPAPALPPIKIAPEEEIQKDIKPRIRPRRKKAEEG
jgi:hypothetical protein